MCCLSSISIRQHHELRSWGKLRLRASNFGIRSHRGEKIQKIKKCQRPPRLASASIGFNQGYRAVRPRISSMIAVLASA